MTTSTTEHTLEDMELSDGKIEQYSIKKRINNIKFKNLLLSRYTDHPVGGGYGR